MNKIFKFFCSCLVVCSVASVATSCSDDNDPTYLDEVRVSSSYVAIPQAGGSATITVNSSADWAFASQRWIVGKDTLNAAAPQWLTVSTVSGGAGETSITFSAESTLDGRTCELLLECGGRTQRINVIQGLSTVSNATCAEVIAGPDSKTYRVTGTVKSIVNTTYGNWYLEDATGQIYIYGTLDKAGATKNFLSLGIEVGDEVTVEGPKTTYNGTVELVDVTVVKISKSLIKVDSLSTTAPVSHEGGLITAYLTCKGSTGVSCAIPDDADWLSVVQIKGGTSTSIVFRAAPNTGSYRKTTLTFLTTDASGKQYTAETTVAQEAMPDAPGSLAKPFTVAEAIAKCQEIGSTASDQVYYAKGKISSIKEVSTSYGYATFNISDDGNDENFVTCYRSFSLDNQKFTSEDEIAVGDEVIICGKLVNYKDNTPEFAQGCYIVSIKKANAAGTEAKPFTVAEAIAKCLEIGDTSDGVIYYAKGKISSIKEVSTNYGNATFNISDNGADENALTVFRALSLGNQKFTATDEIKVGDEVVVCGKLVNYKGETPEFSGNVYVYSINGQK